MPKKEIDPQYKVQHLSILDENGQPDKDLEPDISPETLLKLYRTMILARKFDERMLTLQRQGKIGTFAPVKGQEAQVGAVAVLEPQDWFCPSFREMPSELWRGKKMEHILALFGGFNEGGEIPEGFNNLPLSIPVGSQTLHAAGIAYAIKYRKQKHVAMTFFGDGATSEGDFHEALNFAAVFQVPAIFVCQNNQWAISIPRHRQTRSKTLAQKALAYDMPGIQVDGNDVLAVYAAAKEAVDRARAGEGPTLLECVTYRMSVHTTADDPKRYRTEEEVEAWIEKDPIRRFDKYLRDKGLLDDDKVRTLDDEVTGKVGEAVARWEDFSAKTPDPLSMFDHLFQELPPYVAQQKEFLEAEPVHKQGGK